MSSVTIRQQYGLWWDGGCIRQEFDTRAEAEAYREANGLWQHRVVVREIQYITKVGRWVGA